MTSNGEVRDCLIPCLRDVASGLPVLRRSNVLTITKEKVIPNAPIVVLIESGINLPRPTPHLPADQAFKNRIENRQHEAIPRMEPLEHVSPFPAFRKSFAQFRMQLDQFSERVTCLLTARHELLVSRKIFVKRFGGGPGSHFAALLLETVSQLDVLHPIDEELFVEATDFTQKFSARGHVTGVVVGKIHWPI